MNEGSAGWTLQSSLFSDNITLYTLWYYIIFDPVKVSNLAQQLPLVIKTKSNIQGIVHKTVISDERLKLRCIVQKMFKSLIISETEEWNCLIIAAQFKYSWNANKLKII